MTERLSERERLRADLDKIKTPEGHSFAGYQSFRDAVVEVYIEEILRITEPIRNLQPHHNMYTAINETLNRAGVYE